LRLLGVPQDLQLVGVDVSVVVVSRKEARIELVARVRARREELEEAIFARIRDSDPILAAGGDPEYVAGLRTTVAAAVEHALAGIEFGEEVSGLVPPEAVAQARRAARAGVSVDTVLRRYVLGSTLMGDFLMQEADSESFVGQGAMMREVLSAQAAVLDRLLTAITVEYMRELERGGRSPDARRAERVQRLLSGGLCETAELGYELSGWHLGVIATGVAGAQALARIAAEMGSSLLCVPRGESTAWAWLGGRHAMAARDIERALGAECVGHVSLAVGEPGHGIEGWRLTHRQAQAALRVALHDRRPLTRYAEVALLASVLRDEALSGSLVEIYLSPLGATQNGGAVLRKTLRAYFAAERNASSAASALGVTRHTVENRLRTIEEKLGQTLRTRQAELEVALRLEALGEHTAGSAAELQ
jgi:PucR C-terminal helix-turn-helix domain/GGDEF-like domain